MKQIAICNTPQDRQRVTSFISGYAQDKRLKVTVEEYTESRSSAQNRLLWMWNNAIQRHMAESFGQLASAEDWHDLLVSRLCPAEVRTVSLPNGESVEVGRARTSKFSTAEMADYLTRLDSYCAEYLFLLLPHPSDLIYAAFGDRRHG